MIDPAQLDGVVLVPREIKGIAPQQQRIGEARQLDPTRGNQGQDDRAKYEERTPGRELLQQERQAGEQAGHPQIASIEHEYFLDAHRRELRGEHQPRREQGEPEQARAPALPQQAQGRQRVQDESEQPGGFRPGPQAGGEPLHHVDRHPGRVRHDPQQQVLEIQIALCRQRQGIGISWIDLLRRQQPRPVGLISVADDPEKLHRQHDEERGRRIDEEYRPHLRQQALVRPAQQQEQGERHGRRHDGVFLGKDRERIGQRGRPQPAALIADQPLEKQDPGRQAEQRRHQDGALDQVGHAIDGDGMQGEEQRAGECQPGRGQRIAAGSADAGFSRKHARKQPVEKQEQQQGVGDVQCQIAQAQPMQRVGGQFPRPLDTGIGQPAQFETQNRL